MVALFDKHVSFMVSPNFQMRSTNLREVRQPSSTYYLSSILSSKSPSRPLFQVAQSASLSCGWPLCCVVGLSSRSRGRPFFNVLIVFFFHCSSRAPKIPRLLGLSYPSKLVDLFFSLISLFPLGNIFSSLDLFIEVGPPLYW